MKRSIKKILLSTATLGMVGSLSSILLTSCVREEGSDYDGPVDIKLKWSKLGYTENAEAGQAGMSIGWIGASVLPETADQSVEYKIVIPEDKQGQPGWVIPSWLSLKEDQEGHTHLAWSQEVNSTEGNSGMYYFCIGAFSKQNMLVSATTAWNIKLQVNNPAIVPTSVNIIGAPSSITEYTNVGGHCTTTMSASCAPSEADQEVKWELSGAGCSNFHIADGNIYWEKTTDPAGANRTLTIKVTSVADSTVTKSINIPVYVKQPVAENVSINYVGGSDKDTTWHVKANVSGSSWGHFDIKVTPSEAKKPEIYFDQIGSGYAYFKGLKAEATGAEENSYRLTWDASNAPGTYGFKVWAECDGVKSNSYIVPVRVESDPVISVDSIKTDTDPSEKTSLGLNGELYVAGVASKEMEATVSPVTANNKVTWSIEDSTSNKISIDRDSGFIRWGNIGTIGTYTFNVRATSVDDPTKSTKTQTPLTLTIAKPEVSTINITYNGQDLETDAQGNPSYTTLAEQTGALGGTFEAEVSPAGADQEVTWSIESADQTQTLPSQLSIDPTGTHEAILKWAAFDNSFVGNKYQIIVRATSKTTTSKTVIFNKIIDFYVNEWYIESSNISNNWFVHYDDWDQKIIDRHDYNKSFNYCPIGTYHGNGWIEQSVISFNGTHFWSDRTLDIVYSIELCSDTSIHSYTDVIDPTTGTSNPLREEYYGTDPFMYHKVNNKIIFKGMKKQDDEPFSGTPMRNHYIYAQFGIKDQNGDIHWISKKNSNTKYTFILFSCVMDS